MKQVSSLNMIQYIAFAQVVPLILFPWSFSTQSAVAVGFLVALSAFLGWSLWSHKAWGRKLTIFVQGLNIIIRLITFFKNVSAGDSFDWGILITFVCSGVLSWILLTYIDRPEVQLVFES